MRLLQAGVDRSVIAVWLAHERLETAPISLEATLAMTEKPLSKMPPKGEDAAVINQAINSSPS
jgi:hypothetical protein